MYVTGMESNTFEESPTASKIQVIKYKDMSSQVKVLIYKTILKYKYQYTPDSIGLIHNRL